MRREYGRVFEIEPKIYDHFVSIRQPIGCPDRAKKHATWWIIKNLTNIPLYSLAIDDVVFEEIDELGRNRVILMRVPWESNEFVDLAPHNKTPRTVIDSIPVKFVDLLACNFQPPGACNDTTITLRVDRNIKPLDRPRIREKILGG